MNNAEQLKAIYAGPSFKSREQVARFDAGGSYYDAVAFANPVADQMGLIGGGPAQEPLYQGPIAGGSAASDQQNGVPTDPAATSASNAPIAPPSSISTNLLTNSQLGNSGNPNAAAGSGSGGIGGILNSIGSSNLLPAIVGILSAAGHAKQSAAASKLPSMPAMPGFNSPLPALPGANSSNGFGPPGGYNFSNYPGAGAGTGFAPRTQAPPLPMSSYYTYGQGPEHQFFTPVNPNTGVAPPTGSKKGGRVKKYAIGGLNTGMQGPIRPALGGPPPMARPMPMPPQPPGPQPMTRPMLPPQMPARPAPVPTMPMARPMPPPMGNTQPMPMNPMMRRADGGSTDKGTAYANTWGQYIPPVSQNPAQSNVTGAPARGALSDAIPHRTMVGHAGGGPMSQGQRPQTMSRHVRGPGDGTSDSIPARLANGEYVLSADVVSGLGNGDNGSGAKKLDAFVHNVRVHKSQNASQGKLPADAKPIPHYMSGNV
jgi:hypothetical protein